MQTAFVTGATGFLGAHLTCALLQKGYGVKALRRPQSSMNEFNFIAGLYFGQPGNLGVKNLEWVEGDVTDYDSLTDHIEPDRLVFHCAALVSFHASDKQGLFRVNVKGTENVVNACLAKGCRKLIYASSTAAVGRAEAGEITSEEDLWDEKDKPSNYSISKFYAELEVWRGMEEGLNAVIVNPPLIIGPGNWQRSTGRFFYNASKNFPFYTRGSNAFVYVKDVAGIMIILAESSLAFERFLLVGENLSYREFMSRLADAFGTKKPYIHARPWMTTLTRLWFGLKGFLTGTRGLITRESAASSLKNTSYSSQKIRKALPVDFTSMEEAIRETVRAGTI